MEIAVCICRRTGACHVQKARSRLRKIRHIFPFKINCGRSAAVCKKPFKDCSKTVHKFACTIRYTMIVGRENTLPPANSFLHLVFFLSPFLFTLFFILHWYAPCFPSPWETGRFPLRCSRPRKGNKSFTAYSKSVHTSPASKRYTKHVDEGSRKPASTEVYRPFISLLPPLFQICVVNRQSAVVSFPPTSGGASLCFAIRPNHTGSDERDAPRLDRGCILGCIKFRLRRNFIPHWYKKAGAYPAFL